MHILKNEKGCLVLVCQEAERESLISSYLQQCKAGGLRVLVMTEEAHNGMVQVSCIPFLLEAEKSASKDQEVIYLDTRADQTPVAAPKAKALEHQVSFGDFSDD